MTTHLHLMHARLLTAGQRRVAAARGEGDEGQGTIEYIGIAIVISVIIATVLVSGVDTAIADGLKAAVEKVTSQG